MRYIIITALLVIAPMARAQNVAVLAITWEATLVWDDGKDTPATQADIDHHLIYICDAPIVAGGADADDPLIERPACVGQLDIIPATEETTHGEYALTAAAGNLYFRISTVSSGGVESKLSDEVMQPYEIPEAPRRLKKPHSVHVQIEIPAAR
jgi:hypothetical protein